MFKRKRKQQSEIIVEDLKKALDDINQQLLESNEQMLNKFKPPQK